MIHKVITQGTQGICMSMRYYIEPIPDTKEWKPNYIYPEHSYPWS